MGGKSCLPFNIHGMCDTSSTNERRKQRRRRRISHMEVNRTSAGKDFEQHARGWRRSHLPCQARNVLHHVPHADWRCFPLFSRGDHGSDFANNGNHQPRQQPQQYRDVRDGVDYGSHHQQRPHHLRQGSNRKCRNQEQGRVQCEILTESSEGWRERRGGHECEKKRSWVAE